MHSMNKTRTPSYAWELEREARTPRNGWNAGAQFTKPAPRRACVTYPSTMEPVRVCGVCSIRLSSN